MDVYHQVLQKLCEETDGNNSKAADFNAISKRNSVLEEFLEMSGVLPTLSQ